MVILLEAIIAIVSIIIGTTTAVGLVKLFSGQIALQAFASICIFNAVLILFLWWLNDHTSLTYPNSNPQTVYLTFLIIGAFFGFLGTRS